MLKFTFIAVIKEYIKIEGFNCKPGFGMFCTSDGHIAFSSGWTCPLNAEPCDATDIFIYVKNEDGGYEGNWYYVGDDEYQFLQQQYDYYRDKAFEDAYIKASKIPTARLAPPVYIKLTDTVPGDKCNNGGEYGFYSHYEPTYAQGVFWTWTTTTCDFDRCGTTGYNGGHYEVLTKKRFRRLIQISDKIEKEGNLYNPSYDNEEEDDYE